jgi:hypothetical protein
LPYSFIEFFELLWNILSQVFQYIGILVVFLIILYVISPERYEKICIHILKVASYVSKRLDKNYAERDIEHLVNSSAKSLNKYFPVITRGIKILWAESDDVESYLDRGFVVVRMKHHKSRARNIARALMAYIPHILPPEVGAVMETDLALAISYIIAIGMAEREPEVVRQIHEAVSIRFEDSLTVKDLLPKLEEIDKESLFSRILLPEVVKACLNVYPRRPQDLRSEIMDLVELLYALVKGDLRKPIIKGKYLNLALIRVAKLEKILLDPELEAHLKFAEKANTRTIYVLAAGQNAKLASKLTARISKELKYTIDFEDVYRAMYKGSLTNIYCGKLSTS